MYIYHSLCEFYEKRLFWIQHIYPFLMYLRSDYHLVVRD